MNLKQFKKKYMLEGFKRGYNHALNEAADKIEVDTYWHPDYHELGYKFRESDRIRNAQERNKERMKDIARGFDDRDVEVEIYHAVTDYIIRHVFGDPKGNSNMNVFDGVTPGSRVVKYIAKLILKATQPGEYPEAVLEEAMDEVRANRPAEKLAEWRRLPFDLHFADTYEQCLDNLYEWISAQL